MCPADDSASCKGCSMLSHSHAKMENNEKKEKDAKIKSSTKWDELIQKPVMRKYIPLHGKSVREFLKYQVFFWHVTTAWYYLFSWVISRVGADTTGRRNIIMLLYQMDRLLSRDIAPLKSRSMSRTLGCTDTTARLRDGTSFLFHYVFYPLICALAKN